MQSIGDVFMFYFVLKKKTDCSLTAAFSSCRPTVTVEENSLNILHRREAAGRVIDMDGLDWTLEMINICIFLSLSLIIRRF